MPDSESFVQKFLTSKIGSASFWLLLSQGLLALTWLLADAIFARVFSPADFGTWKKIQLFSLTFFPALMLGLGEGFKFFAAREPENDGRHFAQTLVFLLVMALVFQALWLFLCRKALFFGFENGALGNLAFWFLPFFLAFALNRVARFFAINRGTTQRFLGAALAGFATCTGILTWFWSSDNSGADLQIALSFSVLVYALPVIFGGVWLFRGLNFRGFRWSDFGRYLHFGLPLFLSSLAVLLYWNFDKWLISSLESPAFFGRWSVGALEIPILGMLGTTLGQAYFPKIVGDLQAGHEAEAKRLWLDVTRRLSLLAFPITALLLLLHKPLISNVYGEQFVADAAPVFKNYILISLWRNNTYGALLTAKGESRAVFRYLVLTLIFAGATCGLLYIGFGPSAVSLTNFLAEGFAVFLFLRHEGLLGAWLRAIFGDWFLVGCLGAVFLIYFLD